MTSVEQRAASGRGQRNPLREVAVFVAAAYLGTWIVGGLAFVVLDLGETGLVAGVLMVAVAALVLTRRDEGSVAPMTRQIVRWRIAVRWYAAAIGLPFLLVAGAVALTTLLTGEGLGDDPAGWTFLLLLPLYVLLIGGPEELGWRGYALPRLQVRYDALTSSLLLGLIWLGWHLPVFAFPGEVFVAVPFVPYAVIAVASSVVYTWLYNSTRGSILLAMILHGATNLSLVWVETPAVWYGFTAGWVAVAVGLVVVRGRTTLSRQERHTVHVGER